MWTKKSLYYRIVLPLSKVLEEMEYFGIKVDQERMNQIDSEFKSRIKSLDEQIFEFTGRINLNSYPQLREALYNKLKLPSYYETEKGLKSTNIFSLIRIKINTQHPVASMLIERQRLQTLVSKYIDNMWEHIDNNSYIHPQYIQLTFGGRLAVSSPALHGIPSRTKDGRRIKEFFTAKDGYVIVQLDYKQIEMRFLAWLAKERVLLDIFKTGGDPHGLTASKIFDMSYEDACNNKSKRRVGKVTNFLIIYGGGIRAMQNTFLKDYELWFADKECQSFLNAYFRTYPAISRFQDRVEQEVLQKNVVKNLFGRERKFFVTTESSRKSINDAARQAISHIVSGSSTGDYVPLKVIEVEKYLKQTGYGRTWKLLHDGIYWKIREDKAEEFMKIAKEILETSENPVIIDLPTEGSIAKRESDL